MFEATEQYDGQNNVDAILRRLYYIAPTSSATQTALSEGSFDALEVLIGTAAVYE